MCKNTPQKWSSISPQEKQKLNQTVEKIAPKSVTKEQKESIVSMYAQHRQLMKELSK